MGMARRPANKASSDRKRASDQGGGPSRSGNEGAVRTSGASRVDVVSFDLRRNLIKILGEDHYPYAEYLYHELAANAWDEDATEVQIVEETIRAASRGQAALYDVVVRDNGNGMDFELLKEYFTVGDSSKPDRAVSERLGRQLIGRIGVGKVAILKAARRWRVTTERHLGLEDPVRLTVFVDVDEWISGKVPAFAVQYLEPTGEPGTEIVLEGVETRMRVDRILRHLQRLPLGDDFMVWRNGEPIPPRQWYGIDKVDIATEVEWLDGRDERTGRINGEIWVLPDAPKRKQPYIKEPATETEGLQREPGGIEIRVNRDMITREFFGHEAHGHGVNRIWGWVEAPWLPILGNRTDYQRDHPASQAFYNAVKPIFDKIYETVRYEHDSREQERRQQRKGRQNNAGEDTGASGNGESENGAGAGDDAAEAATYELLASRYGDVLYKVLTDHPELAPVIGEPAKTSRGRPAQDRIYPVRRTGHVHAFERNPYGSELAVEEVPESGTAQSVVTGSRLRTDRAADSQDGAESLEAGEMIVNTTAGIRLQFLSLGPREAPYRWSLEKPDELTLDINTDHKLYGETDRPGGPLHRLHCSWLVALALAERAHPSSGLAIADFVEMFSWELFEGWTGRRRSSRQS